MKVFIYLCMNFCLCFFDKEQPGMGQPMHAIVQPCEAPKTRRAANLEEYRAPIVGDTVRINTDERGVAKYGIIVKLEMNQ